MLIRNNWREHLPWILGIVVASVVAVVAYVARVGDTGWERRPTGSSGILFVCGIIGGSICFFEFLLWPRKKFRTLRIGQVKAWMRAHIWLGLLAVPMLIIHSGFWFTNTEATILFILFVVVILSGIWGLILQQYIPQKTLNEIPAETIRALVRSARTVCVLADHTKTGIVGLSTFMDLADVDTLVTDAGIPDRARRVLEETVEQLVLADPAGRGRGDRAGAAG